jgi:predicted DNA-binding transcriptional regulator AlpA
MNPITSWDQLPLVLEMEHMRQLFKTSAQGVYRRVQARKIPPPFQTYPMQWSRADVEAWWAGKTSVMQKVKR